MKDLQPTILALGIVFPIIAILSVVLRFQARRIKGDKLLSDDLTILASLILSVAVTIDIILMTLYGGLGTHAEYTEEGYPIDLDAIVYFGKTTYALQILTWPAVGMTKVSVLLMYKRIFTTPKFKLMSWILIVFVVLWTIAFSFALAFSCTPVTSNWDFTLEFTCVNQEALFTTALATDAATDFLVLFLPAWKVWQLNMPIRRKLLIIGIFLLGGLVSVIGIIRIHFLTTIFGVLEVSPQADTTYLYAPVFYWTIIETNVGVLSACLPTLRPIQNLILNNMLLIKLKGSFSNLISSGSRSKTSDIRLGSMDEERLHQDSHEIRRKASQSKIFQRYNGGESRVVSNNSGSI